MTDTSYTSAVNESGRIVIPAPLRRALDIKAGTVLTFRLETSAIGKRLTVSRPEDAVARAQAVIRRRRRRGQKSAADELVAERHREAKRE